MIYAGSHISSAKGYEGMGKQAVKLGANTFAFFTRNPRGGKAKAIVPEDIEKFKIIAKEQAFGPIVAHAPYTMNCCAEKEDLRTFAREMMLDDMARMEYIPGNYYNFHPGSHVGQGIEVGIEKIAEILNQVITKEQSTMILLETMAGKGSEVGSRFEELKKIIDLVEQQDKIGVCMDSCHVWDAGYNIVEDLDGVLDEFDQIIGLNQLRAMHLNDSMNPLGAHKDRHAKLGEGHIGLDTFSNIINHPKLAHLPFILETPNDDAGWTKEIQYLRSMEK